MKSLRTLIIEDSQDDAELLLQELKRGGYSPVHVRVDTAEAMSTELATGTWDIAFSDFTMPRFNAFDALTLLRGTGLDIPFIIVSGTIGEDLAVTAMKAGAHDYILKNNLKRLVPAAERELREAETRQENRQLDETIHFLAYTDQITKLPNRIRFHEQVVEAITIAQRERRSIALLLMDIDRFKDVNDTLGHDRGDILLQQVGTLLRGALFAPDIIARLGGDEFGILLPRLAAAGDVRDVVRKLHNSLLQPFMIDGIPIVVEAAIGVAIAPEHADSADRLLQLADIAMYHAKQLASGYAIYDSKYNLHSPEQLGLMAELRDSIEKNQLVLHFQPKLEIKTGRIVGVEALVRWQHPRLGLLFPDKFIMTAERTGLIGALTSWVLTEALRYCRSEYHQGIELRMSVNLSARSLHDPQLLKMITKALKTTDTKPNQLMLEVTESAIMLDPKSAEEALTALSRMGVGLSIDDFGTGYTSLAGIKRFPIDEIKIDRSFITNMLTEHKDAMIVRSVIELGHNLGLTVVAEGIETKKVLDALVDLGCDGIQGYFISKPQTGDALRNWLLTSSWGKKNK